MFSLNETYAAREFVMARRLDKDITDNEVADAGMTRFAISVGRFDVDGWE